jgi:magnesium chelatase family protein
MLYGKKATKPCEDVMRGLARLDIDCTDAQRSRYYSKISGPLLDRIDIQVEVPEVKFQDMIAKAEGECSEKTRERVTRVRPAGRAF